MPYAGPLPALDLADPGLAGARSFLRPLSGHQRLVRGWALGLARKLACPGATRLMAAVPLLGEVSRRFLGRMDRMRVQVCGAPFRLDLLRRSVSRSVYLGVRWPAGVAATLRSHVRPGSTAIDVGANVGWMSVHMADAAGPDGTVLAFEPEPRNFEILSLNARHARWRNVIPFAVAAGDRVGRTELWISPADVAEARVGKPLPERSSTRVAVTTIDRVADERRTRVHFVKIDAQGAEAQALRGMRETLRSPHLRGLVLQFWPAALRAAGDDPREMLSALREAGLRCANAPNADGDARGLVADVPSDGWADLLFLRR